MQFLLVLLWEMKEYIFYVKDHIIAMDRFDYIKNVIKHLELQSNFQKDADWIIYSMFNKKRV